MHYAVNLPLQRDTASNLCRAELKNTCKTDLISPLWNFIFFLLHELVNRIYYTGQTAKLVTQQGMGESMI